CARHDRHVHPFPTRRSSDLKAKAVALTVGVTDALVRPVEMPFLPMDDLRMVLKHNSRNYLQQDLTNHVFDCHIIANGRVAKAAEDRKSTRLNSSHEWISYAV